MSCFLFRFVEGPEQKGVFLQRHDRVERRVFHVGRGAAFEPNVRLVRQTLTERQHHAALADTCFARENDGLAAALCREAPSVHQKPKLLTTSDHRSGQILSRFTRAARTRRTNRAMDRDGPGDAFQRVHAELFSDEMPSHQPERRVAHDHGPRCREFLEPRREIRGVPERQGLSPGARPHFSDHHGAGVETDARRELHAVAAFESRFDLRERVDDRSPARVALSASSSCAVGKPKYTTRPSPRYCATYPSWRSTAAVDAS